MNQVGQQKKSAVVISNGCILFMHTIPSSHYFLMFYPSHKTDEIKNYAANNGLDLNFIPAGQTGEWQPLDYRIFGSLKQRARAAFDRSDVVTKNNKGAIVINWATAVEILVKCWDEIPQDEVINAWSPLAIDKKPREIIVEEEDKDESYID